MSKNTEIADRIFERILTVLERYYGLKPTLDYDCAALYESLKMVIEMCENDNRST